MLALDNLYDSDYEGFDFENHVYNLIFRKPGDVEVHEVYPLMKKIYNINEEDMYFINNHKIITFNTFNKIHKTLNPIFLRRLVENDIYCLDPEECYVAYTQMKYGRFYDDSEECEWVSVDKEMYESTFAQNEWGEILKLALQCDFVDYKFFKITCEE